MARAVRALATLASLTILATACGASEEPAAEDTPAAPSGSTPSPSETASAEPEATVTEEPLSRFEDEPAVQVLRDWGTAYARAVNARDAQVRRLAPLSTPAGMAKFPGYAAEDIGLLYPGPLPFTPTAVEVNGTRATVPVCTWVQGFAQERATKQPAAPKQIVATEFLLVRGDGGWKVDDFIEGQGNCGPVPVKGLGF